MKITINGHQKDFSEDQNLQEIINSMLPNSERVIAEINGNIIKKDRWNESALKDGDVIELVTFVGGG